MYYKGKMLDTFESAMVHLLEYNFGRSVRHIDCIGYRCFGFRTSGTIKKWFSPRIETEKAVESLAGELGIGICSKEAAKGKDIRHACDLYGAAVFGPVKRGITAPLAREYYYQGAENYLFIRKAAQNRYLVTDPQGMPGLLFENDELEQMAGMDASYLFYIMDSDGLRMPSLRHILERGLRYHREIWDEESREIKNAVESYCGIEKRGEQIALQCAVTNLGLQLDKAFLLADECGGLDYPVERSYFSLKNDLCRCAGEKDLKSLPNILEELWELLEKCQCQRDFAFLS